MKATVAKGKVYGFWDDELWEKKFPEFPGNAKLMLKQAGYRKMKHFADLVYKIAPGRIIKYSEEKKIGVWNSKYLNLFIGTSNHFIGKFHDIFEGFRKNKFWQKSQR